MITISYFWMNANVVLLLPNVVLLQESDSGHAFVMLLDHNRKTSWPRSLPWRRQWTWCRSRWASLILKYKAVSICPQVLHLLELLQKMDEQKVKHLGMDRVSFTNRFKPDVIGEELVEYLGGVDARAVLLPLLHDLRAHHVQLLLHVVQSMVETAQRPTVFTHREVLTKYKKIEFLNHFKINQESHDDTCFCCNPYMKAKKDEEKSTDPIEHSLRFGG